MPYSFDCLDRTNLWSGPSLTGNVEFGDLGFQESGNLVYPCNKKRLQGLDQEEQHLLDLQRAQQSVIMGLPHPHPHPARPTENSLEHTG